jgi:hypothetical protein
LRGHVHTQRRQKEASAIRLARIKLYNHVAYSRTLGM